MTLEISLVGAFEFVIGPASSSLSVPFCLSLEGTTAYAFSPKWASDSSFFAGVAALAVASDAIDTAVFEEDFSTA